MDARHAELVLIAAVARNGAIGGGNDLLFREPADQRHFRDATMGHTVIMGRKTWDSLPARFRPLPGRHNVVVSRNPALDAPGAQVVASLGAALAAADAMAAGTANCTGDSTADAAAAGRARHFVAGGAQLYALALPRADTLLLTEIDADLDGDTFFPAWDRSAFALADAQPMRTDTGVAYRFARYCRLR